MHYRRFGRTELQMPVFSCGGMRYQQAWSELAPEVIEKAGQDNLEACIYRALELGINHIETARGYGSSEMQLGQVLPAIPREKLIVQTKIGPKAAAKEFLDQFEKSMAYLKLDYVDLLSFHGINNDELLDWVLKKDGCMEVVRKLQREGRVRFVGYSTHGPTEVITKSNATGEFDYFNVHYYFVNELNCPCIEEAARQDMGVFIISPTDKGGRLQQPSDKMRELCAPLSPIEFNNLWCLSKPQIHTLSIGAARPSDFDEHIKSLVHYDNSAEIIAPVEARLRGEIARIFGDDWMENWSSRLPIHSHFPDEVNVREILRIFTYGKAFDLVEWAKGRYNLLGNANHFFPGSSIKAIDSDEKWAQLAQKVEANRFAAQIPTYLREAHELLAGEDRKRQSAGG